MCSRYKRPTVFIHKFGSQSLVACGCECRQSLFVEPPPQARCGIIRCVFVVRSRRCRSIVLLPSDDLGIGIGSEQYPAFDERVHQRPCTVFFLGEVPAPDTSTPISNCFVVLYTILYRKRTWTEEIPSTSLDVSV